MPVKLYLQVIGQTQIVNGLEECASQDLLIKELPTKIRYCSI